MGFFNRKKDTTPKASVAPLKEAKKKEEPAAKKEAVAPKAARATGAAYRVLVRPIVTEKTTAMGQHSAYAFRVSSEANKIEIRKAVETVYGVHVEAVRVMRMPGKAVRSRRGAGRRSSWRKALVTLKKGERIDLYANA